MAAAERVVVVGASAGGIAALSALLAGVPADLAAGVCVVLHQPWGRSRALTQMLEGAGPLPVDIAVDGASLEEGRVHVAAAGLHLLCAGGWLRLSTGPLEHGLRPAIDPLFRSAAESFGPSAVGIVLSGPVDDGSSGALAIRMSGGSVLVQDPDEAVYPDMPRHTIDTLGAADVDAVLAAEQLGPFVADLVGRMPPTRPQAEPAPGRAGWQVGSAAVDGDAGLTCPSCAGPLHEAQAGTRLVCRVGHGWSLETLAVGQIASLENGLWGAVRILEERASLSERLSVLADLDDHARAADRHRRGSEIASTQARAVRQVIAESAGLFLGAEDDAAPRSA